MKTILTRSIFVLLFSALAFMGAHFENQIIQVSATPDGNVSVSPATISFSSVFPAEQLSSAEITIQGSETFEAQSVLSHVYYEFNEYPQALGNPLENITVGFPYIFSGSRQTFCRIFTPQSTSHSDLFFQQCKPILCQYIATKKGASDNPAELGGDETIPPSERDPGLDYELNAPHSQFAPHARGHFARGFGDFWKLDLTVPCFDGQCSQDHSIHDSGPTLSRDFESDTFGCDIEVLVTAVTQNAL